MGHDKLLAQATYGVIFHRRTVLRERKRQRWMSKNRGEKKRQNKIFKKAWLDKDEASKQCKTRQSTQKRDRNQNKRVRDENISGWV